MWSHKPPNTHCLLTFTNRPCIFIRALVICGNFFTSIIIIIVIITNSNSSKWQPQECIKSRRCNNGRTSLEKKLPTAVIIMNQWKISRTCKCNNFAINRTRIMSGNCYVPVTHSLSIYHYRYSAVVSRMFYFNNTQDKHICHKSRDPIVCWNFSCDKAHSNNVFVCAVQSDGISEIRGLFPLVTLLVLRTCVLCYFTGIKLELN